MIRMLKRLFCKHEKVAWYKADLVRIDDGTWITKHRWKCCKCGKVISNEKD